MSRKRYTPEQTISMLREAEVLQIQGSKMADVCRKLGISSEKHQSSWLKHLYLPLLHIRRIKEIFTVDGRRANLDIALFN